MSIAQTAPLNGAPPLVAVAQQLSYNSFAVIGFVELIVGLAAVLAADFLHIFSLLTVVAGCLGPIVLACCLIRATEVKVYDLFSGALAFGYGTGSLYSLVSYLAEHRDLVSGDDISQYWYARTLGLVVAACGALHLLGRLDLGGLLLRQTNFVQAEGRRALVMAVVMLGIYIVYVKTGKIGFDSNIATDAADEASVSPVAAVLVAVITPIGGLALSIALTVREVRNRWWLMALAGMLLLVQIPAGRRVFAFAAITYALAILVAKRPRNLFSFRNLVLMGVATMVLHVGTTFFYAMRLAAWSHPHARVSTLQLIPEALDIYLGGHRTMDLQAAVAKNVQNRSFILDYLKELAAGEARSGPLYGQDALRAVVTATPSIIFPGKHKSHWFGSEEPLINPPLGLPVWDAPNSIFTAGVADFGTVGIFLYPLLLCFILARIVDWAHERASRPAAMLISLYVCDQLLSVECDIATYAAMIRMVLVIVLVAWLFFRRLPTAQMAVA